MANVLNQNPIIIDTAAGTVLLTVPIRVKKIRWVGGTTLGHTVSVQDQNSHEFWASTCPGSSYVEETDFTTYLHQSAVMNGLKVPTLGSGKLYIYQ